MGTKEVVKIFGEPDKDIGSGLFIFVYTLDDGSEIHLGCDGQKLLYAQHGENDLFE